MNNKTNRPMEERILIVWSECGSEIVKLVTHDRALAITEKLAEVWESCGGAPEVKAYALAPIQLEQSTENSHA